jgi:hypothetical protein
MGIVNRRSCGADDLRIILDLGSQPIANALLLEEELGRPEARSDHLDGSAEIDPRHQNP